MSDAIGRLRARIALAQPQIVADDMGGGVTTYVTAETVWADVAPVGASARADFDDRVSANAYRVTIRAPSGARAGWRVLWRTRSLLITAVTELGDGRMALDCEEETQ